MELKPGSRWRSSVCTAEVVVVRPPKVLVVLECGGHPMKPFGADQPEGLAPLPHHCAGVLMGKRYFDEESGIEALGNKPGEGSLSIDGRPLKLKEAKPLPSSD
jgi:hypothetical protein